MLFRSTVIAGSESYGGKLSRRSGVRISPGTLRKPCYLLITRFFVCLQIDVCAKGVKNVT